MTEIANTNNAPAEARSIEIITAEINAIRGYAQAVVLSSAVEIGRRLKEAKELLPHGEWGAWLQEKVDFSQVTATRYMKLFEEYADRQGSLFGAEVNLSTLKNLSVSNALRLLAVPAEEREEFAAEHDVENLSAREMDKLIRERDEAKAARREMEITLRAKDAEHKRLAENMETILRQSADDAERARKLEEQIQELERRPVEVAVQEPDPEELRKRVDAAVAEAVKEAKAAAAEEKKKLKDKLAAAEQALEDKKKEAEDWKATASDAVEKLKDADPEEKERLEREIEALKKQLAMSDAAVVTFNTLFAQAQDIMNRLLGAMAKVDDGETSAKLRAAVRKLLEVYGEKVGT